VKGYHVELEFWDGRVLKRGQYTVPTWTKDEIVSGTDYQWSEGNYSCDCNRSAFLAEADHEQKKLPCGETLRIRFYALHGPDGTIIDFDPRFEEKEVNT
jgi:hypothetical protein